MVGFVAPSFAFQAANPNIKPNHCRAFAWKETLGTKKTPGRDGGMEITEKARERTAERMRMGGKTQWISGIRGQGRESEIGSTRRERERASDNEEAHLNVRFPQVTNTVK